MGITRSPSRENNKKAGNTELAASSGQTQVGAGGGTPNLRREQKQGGGTPHCRQLMSGEKEPTLKMEFLGAKAKVFADLLSEAQEGLKVMGEIPPNTKNEVRKSIERIKYIMESIESAEAGVVIVDKTELTKLQGSNQNVGQQQQPAQEAIYLAEEIRMLKNAASLDKDRIKAVVKKAWPAEVFVSTKIKVGDPSTGEYEGENLAFWGGKDKVKNEHLFKLAKKHLPEVKELVQNGSVIDNHQVVERMTKIRGRKIPKMSFCFLTEGDELDEMITGLQKISNDLVEPHMGGRVFFAVANPDETETLRKVAEIVLNDSIETTFLVPARSRLAPNRKPGSKGRDNHGENPNGMIRLNSSVKSYADISKMLKDTINLEEIGVEVKNLRRTKNDNLIIITEKKEESELLKKEIEKKVQEGKLENLNIEVAGEKTPIMILDIEGSVNVDEVTRAVQEVLKENQQRVSKETITLKKNRWGGFTAELSVDRSTAKALTELGKIHIGWSVCRVKQKIKIIRCFSCLKIGHSAYECRNKGGNKTKKCFNCTQEGHSAVDCAKPSWCNTCTVTGHRADSAQCPVFRKKINRK